MIQEIIKKLIEATLNKLELVIDASEIKLEHPTVKEHGDFSCNIAMRLASKLKKPPLKIAQEIAKNIAENPSIASVEALEPGFINFRLSEAFMWNELGKIISEKENYGSLAAESRKRVLIEHTQINPNKEPHIGHLRNACIGDTLTKLYRSASWDTKVLYYQNDVGQQIASIVLAFQKQYVNRDEFDSLISWASSAYSDIEKRIEENPDLLKEKGTIQVKIAGQNTPEAKTAQEITTQILKETMEILSYFKIEYDLIVQESDILKNKLWEKTFELLKKKDAFYQAEEGDKKDCWLIKMPDQEDKIIVRSNGVPTYVGNDIANHLWKFGILEDFKYKKLDWDTQKLPLYITTSGEGEKSDQFSNADVIVNVIDQTQTYPQQSVIESLKVLGYEKEAANYYHVNYGFVYLSPQTAEQLGIENKDNAKQIKISGRKGAVVSITNFLNKMEEVLKQKYGSFTSIKEVSNGTVKFELLKYNTYQDIIFDLDSALDLKGFSGPYIQYAFTRAFNVLRKAGVSNLDWQEGVENFDENEKKILRMIYIFPEIIEMSLKEHAPHHICLYLFELAQSFNSFYETSQVIGSDKEAQRILITGATAQILKNGLNFLGIESPEKM